MSITVKWLEDKKDILHIHLNDLWEWEEFHAAFDRALEMVQIPTRFDVILDFTEWRQSTTWSNQPFSPCVGLTSPQP